ncbi:MAG: serine/threonine protein kinase [Clostridia bacterium]|nr:serine/threonine protein kinase [Clostridia bacterium]
MDAETYLKEELERHYTRERELAPGKELWVHNEKDLSLICQTLPKEADSAALRRLTGVELRYAARVYDVIEGKNALFVLTEFVPGETLADAMKRRPLRRSEARRVALDLADALTELHGCGVAHKDVKPENIVIDPLYHARLIDLGIATVFDQARREKTAVLGTVGFAAPEQFGFNRTDPRTDIYAFGVVLNLMLTGCHPTVRLYRTGKYGRILKKCLAVSPEDRYRSAAALRAALAGL